MFTFKLKTRNNKYKSLPQANTTTKKEEYPQFIPDIDIIKEDNLPLNKEYYLNKYKDLPSENMIVIDCQPLQHEVRGIGRYGVNLINTIIKKTNFIIILLVNNFLPNKSLPTIHLRHGVEIVEVIFKNVEDSNHGERNVYYTKDEHIHEKKIADIINSINPTIFLNISEFDRRRVTINLDLLNRNIQTFSILYDLIPLKNGWLDSFNIKFKQNYIKQLNNLKKNTKLFSISEFTKQDCSDVFSNIVTIGTGACIENKFYTSDQIETTLKKFNIHKKYIFCQTSFGENKSLDLLFNQYKLLPDSIKNNILLVLGCNIPIDFIKKHQMNWPNVIITGYLNEDDLWILHENAWLFVFPSSYEGFGIPPVESMCHNKPVIVAKNTSLIEIMENDKFMFDNKNNSCIDLINELYNNENLYNECRDYCFTRKNLFTWDNVFNKINLLINPNSSKNIGIYCSCMLKETDINNFKDFKGYDGLSIVLNLLKTSVKYVMNDKTVHLLNENLHTTNINIIFGVPGKECEKLIKPHMINIIYTMFESNRLPSSWIKCISNCDYCIVPSDEIKMVFLNSGIRIPIHSIELPLEPYKNMEVVNYFKAKENYWENNRPFYVGCIGNWKKRKNIDKLIMAIRNVTKMNYNIVLKIHFAYWYDSNYREEFMRLYNENKNIITFTEGCLSTEEKYEFIKSCDLIISCSSGEGFSYTVREAIIMKVPILLTDVMGHTDIVKSTYCSIIPTNKNNIELGDYIEEKFDGYMTTIKVKDIENSIIECYTNYNKCIEKTQNGYYWYYDNSLHYIFENKIQNFIKKILPRKKPKNKKTLLYVSSCFYPPTDGCHTVILEQIQDMVDRNFEVHIYSCNVSISNNKWNNESINYFLNQGIKITIMDPNEFTIKEQLINDIEIHKFGIVRINYKPELYYLSTFFDYININKENDIFKNIVFILDTLDNVNLSLKLQDKLHISNKTDSINIELWKTVVKDYYNAVEKISYKNFISNYQDIFDVFLSINSYETYIFEKSVNYKQLVLDHIYTIPKNIWLNHTSRNKVVFVGSGNIFNNQGLNYFCEKVLPLLPSDFNIHIYGNCSNECAFNDKRLIKCGYVGNLDDIYIDALFSIVPIITGTGSKIKIFDSLINKIPVVTFIGNRNHISIQGKNCFFVDNEYEFADTCIDLKNNPNLCEINEDFHKESVIDKINNIKNEFYDIL